MFTGVNRSACLAQGLMALTMLAACCAEAAAPRVEFNRDIRPILSENCFACHGFDPKHREAGLRLDTFEGATEMRDGVRAIKPGEPKSSELWLRMISKDRDEAMPPPKAHKPALSAAQLALVEQWIREGATYQRHWAFEPPLARQAPLQRAGQHAVDAFIGARLKSAGLEPSPQAKPEVLLRRLSLDLTGLPPTLAELDAFLADCRAGVDAAYLRAVERLLASPHYGERWGRWWLDQARYADSNGYSIDAPREIWKYRDWVVEALNADMPFDRFTTEQLAGDLLPGAQESQRIATGFHRNTQINQEGGIDKEQFRIDSVFDRVATTGSVWLGLSVGCAQCHDHKFDPITQREYYQFFAFLNSQDEPTLRVNDPLLDAPALEKQLKQLNAQLKAEIERRRPESERWQKQMAAGFRDKLAKPLKQALALPWAKRSPAQQVSLYTVFLNPNDPLRILADRQREVETKLKSGTTTLVLAEQKVPRQTTVFIKGDFTRPDEVVQPGTLKTLHRFVPPQGRPNRLHLAQWIMARDNPLTARVLVNRLWQVYFGRGLVETDNDFGSQGTLPSHPELLDWLALEFQKNWSLKDMHRLLVTSQTYRQDSRQSATHRQLDPNNLLLARQQRLRLEAELVRDVALRVSDQLAPKLGGPPVFPPIPEGVMGQGQVKRVWTASKGADRFRRGMYTFVYRASPPPALNVFDAPDGFSACTRRLRSNTPLQALTLLNDQAFVELAQALAGIVEREGVEQAFRRCTARRPDARERALLADLKPLEVARVLLNMDETVTRE